MGTCWHPRWRRQVSAVSPPRLEPGRRGVGPLRTCYALAEAGRESPLRRQGARPAPRVLAERERGDARRRSCPLGRRRQRGSGVPGSGRLGEGCLAGSQRTPPVGSCLGSGQRLGDCRAAERLESRQVCSGHHASPAGAATCGKASRWGSRGWVAPPAAPRRGSPSLSSGIGRYTPRQPRGNLGPFASFPLGLAPSSGPAAGVSHSPHGPRSEGARLQRRLPAWRGGEIARRPQRGRPAGKLKRHSLLATP